MRTQIYLFTERISDVEILCIAAGEYEKDINAVNPLGMKGQLATAFAQMISALWSGTYQSFPPTKIKVYFCHICNYLYSVEYSISTALLCFR